MYADRSGPEVEACLREVRGAARNGVARRDTPRMRAAPPRRGLSRAVAPCGDDERCCNTPATPPQHAAVVPHAGGPAQAASHPGVTWRLEVGPVATVADEADEIEAKLREWTESETSSPSSSSVNLVLTTGGTGFSRRDVTPEATARVLSRQAPQLIEVGINDVAHREWVS